MLYLTFARSMKPPSAMRNTPRGAMILESIVETEVL